MSCCRWVRLVRRVALALAIGTLLADPFTVGATARPTILVVNSDGTVDKYRQAQEKFADEIARFGGRIVPVDLTSGDAPASLEKLIASQKPDLIYSIGAKAYQLATQAPGDKPLLFSSVINWQRFGRGKNSYGVANELSLSQELSLLRYLLPGVRRIGILYDPGYSRERVTEARAYAREVGLTLVEQTVAAADGEDGLREALSSLLPKVDALWLIADPGLLADRTAVELIFAAGNDQRKPIYTYSDAFLRYGASLVVAADTPTIGRQAANLAESILRREAIADPVQAPAGSHITLNLCQLGKLKARYNEDALDSVNKLLECR